MTATETHIRAFDSTLQTTHRWLQELELAASLENEAEAYSVLRAVLHALRDRLPADEAVDLGAQLPMLIRGFYYEGWKPSTTPKKQRSLDAFLAGMQPLPILFICPACAAISAHRPYRLPGSGAEGHYAERLPDQ